MFNRIINSILGILLAITIIILYTYKNNEIRQLKTQNQELVNRIETITQTYTQNQELLKLNNRISNEINIKSNISNSEDIIEYFKNIDKAYSSNISNYTITK